MTPPETPLLNSTGDMCFYESGVPYQAPGFQELLLGQDMGYADPGFKFQIYDDIGRLVESGFKPNSGSAWYHPQNNLSPGQYSATVTVTNACGSATSRRVVFEVIFCETGSFGRAFPNPTQEWLTFKLDDEISIREIGYTLSYTTIWAVCA